MLVDTEGEWSGRYRPEHDVKLLPCSIFFVVFDNQSEQQYCEGATLGLCFSLHTLTWRSVARGATEFAL